MAGGEAEGRRPWPEGIVPALILLALLFAAWLAGWSLPVPPRVLPRPAAPAAAAPAAPPAQPAAP